MSRALLWRLLRAAIREGNTEHAERHAKELGFRDRRVRERLIEQLWKQQTRRRQ